MAQKHRKEDLEWKFKNGDLVEYKFEPIPNHLEIGEIISQIIDDDELSVETLEDAKLCKRYEVKMKIYLKDRWFDTTRTQARTQVISEGYLSFAKPLDSYDYLLDKKAPVTSMQPPVLTKIYVNDSVGEGGGGH